MNRVELYEAIFSSDKSIVNKFDTALAHLTRTAVKAPANCPQEL